MISRKAVVLDSPVRLAARQKRPRSPWELGIRYAAAYACTLIAVGAAQLVVSNGVVLLLGALTVAGLPLSLLLRHALNTGKLRLKGRPLPRFLINVGVMGITFMVCLLLLGPTIALDTSRLFDLSFATQTVKLLMQAFLIFGVCRCLAILNDKDAVLCTVPSFSVLLLLIVIHKGPEVVAFFALWAVASAILLSLDFRSDIRAAASATVPGLAPNQELKLSGRALATVLGFSLSAAGFLSYTASGEDASGPDESWISSLASRLNGITMDMPDVAGNGGPERQIDFSSLPSTPLRTPLWGIKTQRTDNWEVVKPLYWRLFTLAQYDGHTWSQATGAGDQIPLSPMGPERWPIEPAPLRRHRFLHPDRRGGLFRGYPERPRNDGSLGVEFPSVYDVEKYGPPESHPLFFGASIRGIQAGNESATSSASTWGAAKSASKPAEIKPVRLQQRVRALSSNTGFVPILPGAKGILFDANSGGTQTPSVRERADGSLDVGVMVRDSQALVQSVVAPIEVYGLDQAQPPATKIAQPQLNLSALESRRYLELPIALPARVRLWTREKLRLSKPNESNYKRALRLSMALREGAFYTLRPPLVPANRDATDFFLFDSRRGYCTHFAGSLAATCRVAGIPSRIVSGFTNAEWPPGFPGYAELRESGSHAWVEIWEPGWGWAMVDPTPPESRGNNAPSLLQSWEDVRGIVGEFLVKRFAVLELRLIALLCVLTLLLLAAAQHMRLNRVRPVHGPNAATREDKLARQEIGVSFARVSRRMSRKFRPRAAWETPGEWLASSQEPLNLRDEAPLRELFSLFELARFSPNPMNSAQALRARQAYARLSWAQKPRPKSRRVAVAPVISQSQ